MIQAQCLFISNFLLIAFYDLQVTLREGKRFQYLDVSEFLAVIAAENTRLTCVIGMKQVFF